MIVYAFQDGRNGGITAGDYIILLEKRSENADLYYRTERNRLR